MLFQKGTGKLEARWRGPFRVMGFGGEHEVSYVIQHLSGKKIRGPFHGNDLKPFVPREGYLRSPADLLQPEHTIRVPKKKKGESRRRVVLV